MITSALVVALALSAQATTTPTAAELEASAFVAVNEGRWCEAKALFLRAHALGPAAELLANASLAAAYGGDRANALSLLDTALNSAPREKVADYQKRRAALAAEIKKGGPGTPCPSPATTPEMPTTPTTPTTTPETTTTPTTPETATMPETATTPETAADDDGAFPVWFAVVGAGGAVAVAGAVVATVGALPWFAHDSARQALLAAQDNKVDDDSLVTAQAQARADWEGYGQAAVVAGSVMVGVGVVAVAGGLVWGGAE